MTYLAKILSYALHPTLIPIYGVGILMLYGTVYHYLPLRMQIYLLWDITLYSTILPALTMILLKRLHRLRGRELPRRHHPTILMIVGAICFLLYAFTVVRIPSLAIFRKIAFAGLFCNLYCLLMLRFTRRISTHLTAMGALSALLVMLNIVGEQILFWPMLGTLLLSGILASVRLYMGRHRSLQLLAAYVGGFIVSVIAMLYIQ